jgi:hypothetical protein
MGAAHDVCRGDIAFANAQTPLLFLGMIAVGGMENISLVVHRQLPRIGNALPPAHVLRVWLCGFGLRAHFAALCGSAQDDWMDSELYPHASCSFNLTPVSESGSGAFNGRCERCPPRGHRARDCPSRGNVPKNECCGGYGKHLTGCTQASAQNKERLSENARARLMW